MEIIKVGEILDSAQQQKVKAILQQHGVIMHATETCYGFTCDFFEFPAWKGLFEVKRMDPQKPVSIMVRNLEEARQYGVFDERAARLAEHFWPGPLTIIVDRRAAVPSYVNEGNPTIGIRCPDFGLVMQLLELNGRPLCTTSANISGKPEVYNVQDYLKQMEEEGSQVSNHEVFARPSLILDSGTLPLNPPSTIVRFEGKNYEILRRGELAKKVDDFLL